MTLLRVSGRRLNQAAPRPSCQNPRLQGRDRGFRDRPPSPRKAGSFSAGAADAGLQQRASVASGPKSPVRKRPSHPQASGHKHLTCGILQNWNSRFSLSPCPVSQSDWFPPHLPLTWCGLLVLRTHLPTTPWMGAVLLASFGLSETKPKSSRLKRKKR